MLWPPMNANEREFQTKLVLSRTRAAVEGSGRLVVGCQIETRFWFTKRSLLMGNRLLSIGCGDFTIQSQIGSRVFGEETALFAKRTSGAAFRFRRPAISSGARQEPFLRNEVSGRRKGVFLRNESCLQPPRGQHPLRGLQAGSNVH